VYRRTFISTKKRPWVMLLSFSNTIFTLYNIWLESAIVVLKIFYVMRVWLENAYTPLLGVFWG